jgi:inhibitor of KinA
MMATPVQYRPYGDNAIEIVWSSEISKENSEAIKVCSELVAAHFGEVLLDIIPSYASLLVVFASSSDLNKRINELEDCLKSASIIETSNAYRWFIPVCYDPIYGSDLHWLSKRKNLSCDAIIEQHTRQEYSVHFYGFLPGFFYLGGLPEALHCERKAVPKSLVPKGSVGIGGSQTGVYPQDSPGGWQIIGRTPVTFFDVRQDLPVFANVGDSVVFVAIDKQEFEEIEALGSRYKIRREVIR